MSKQIYLDAPNIGRLEKRFLNKAVDDNYVSTVGPFVSEFEKRFAKRVGAKSAVSIQSGTAALYMCLYELGIGKGDEVIVPALTFIATVNPILHLGAKPVFADVGIDTWNIAHETIKESITKKTKAIIPVHLYGNPCAMDKIRRIASEHNLYVIEDATESLGARYKGKHTGTLGEFGVFSFNGNKIITTGGGGMIIGRNSNRLRHIKFLINQARDEGAEYYHTETGFNYRMTNLEAALGLAQLKRLKDFLKRKRETNAIYRDKLESLDSIDFQKEETGSESSFWLTSILLKKGVDVERLQKRLMRRGITTRRTFMPVPEFPPYKRYKKSGYKNAYTICKRGLCLPSSTLNSKDSIRYVCRIIKEVL